MYNYVLVSHEADILHFIVSVIKSRKLLSMILFNFVKQMLTKMGSWLWKNFLNQTSWRRIQRQKRRERRSIRSERRSLCRPSIKTKTGWPQRRKWWWVSLPVEIYLNVYFDSPINQQSISFPTKCRNKFGVLLLIYRYMVNCTFSFSLRS